jgi:hypothetical protein
LKSEGALVEVLPSDPTIVDAEETTSEAALLLLAGLQKVLMTFLLTLRK